MSCAVRPSLAFVRASLLFIAPVVFAHVLSAQQPQVSGSIDFVAMDYAFRGPASATAGMRTITLRNTGARLHHVQLYRLEDGKRLSDLFPIFFRNKGIAGAPSWAIPAGGPSAALPGQTIRVRQSLAPGRYAAICWIPAPDGQLHFMKGMMTEFEVVAPASSERTTTPVASLRAALREYGVTFDVAPSAGRHTMRIENVGRQAHEFLLVRLAPGKTVEDVAHWSERGQEGAAPIEEWSGVAGLSPGSVAWLDVNLRKGRYAVFCLAPDARDGRPHLLHGFQMTFTVP